ASGRDGIFERYTARVRPVAFEPKVEKRADAHKTKPVKMGKEVAIAPVDADFDRAARWSIRIPEIQSSEVSDVLLRIRYQGDVARLYAGNRLITDDFYKGTPWEIGLRRLP